MFDSTYSTWPLKSNKRASYAYFNIYRSYMDSINGTSPNGTQGNQANWMTTGMDLASKALTSSESNKAAQTMIGYLPNQNYSVFSQLQAQSNASIAQQAMQTIQQIVEAFVGVLQQMMAKMGTADATTAAQTTTPPATTAAPSSTTTGATGSSATTGATQEPAPTTNAKAIESKKEEPTLTQSVKDIVAAIEKLIGKNGQLRGARKEKNTRALNRTIRLFTPALTKLVNVLVPDSNKASAKQ
jgi:hypothetical protein